jgi:hypothetical protein
MPARAADGIGRGRIAINPLTSVNIASPLGLRQSGEENSRLRRNTTEGGGRRFAFKLGRIALV